MRHPGVAVVGTGFIGPVHIEALRRVGLPVVGILGRSPDRSKAAAASLGIPKWYASYDELLLDPKVQAVHIAAPNRLHFSMAAEALGRGKHVVCEKPLAISTDESRRLVELAERSGRVAAVNYNIRYYPLSIEARERIRRGDLGRVYSVTGSYVQDWLLYPTDFNWRVAAAEGGPLRAVGDIGTHWLDLVQFITGLEIEALCADLAIFHPVRTRPLGPQKTFKGHPQTSHQIEQLEIDTEDYGAVLLRFRGGARGTLHVSQMVAGRKNCLRFEIAGERAALAWASERPDELWIGRREEPNACLVRDPALLSAPAAEHTAYPGGHTEGFADTFKQLYHAIYHYIEVGNYSAPPPFPTFADGHRDLVLCEAILLSHREHRWVEVP